MCQNEKNGHKNRPCKQALSTPKDIYFWEHEKTQNESHFDQKDYKNTKNVNNLKDKTKMKTIAHKGVISNT